MENKVTADYLDEEGFGIGELISMAIGAIIVYGISKVVDLSE